MRPFRISLSQFLPYARGVLLPGFATQEYMYLLWNDLKEGKEVRLINRDLFASPVLGINKHHGWLCEYANPWNSFPLLLGMMWLQVCNYRTVFTRASGITIFCVPKSYLWIEVCIWLSVLSCYFGWEMYCRYRWFVVSSLLSVYFPICKCRSPSC